MNVSNIVTKFVLVEGNTDELDFAALNVLTDNQFVQKYNIGTMNSYNWCRIMVQVNRRRNFIYFEDF